MDATPAPHVLASTLYAQLLQSRAREDREAGAGGHAEQLPGASPPRSRRLRTGCHTIDDHALEGGLNYGRNGIVSLAAHSGVLAELTLNFLATHLLDHPSSQAFYIDTHGTFSVARLHRLLCSRLEDARVKASFTHRGGFVYSRTGGVGSDTNKPPASNATEGVQEAGQTQMDLEAQAMKMLDRVSIMKVLDWTGLVEAVGECSQILNKQADERDAMSDAWTGGARKPEVATTGDYLHGSGGKPTPEEQHPEKGGAEDLGRTHAACGEPPPEKYKGVPRRAEIADSEDEDEEILDVADDADDHGINNVGAHPTSTTPSIRNPHHLPNEEERRTTSKPPHDNPTPPSSSQTHPPPPNKHNPTLLIISHLPRLLTPLMRRNHIQGHALLVNLLRSFRHLTLSHRICILIGNAVVGGGRPATMANEHERPSVFADITERPALGRTYPFLLDVSLMVGRVRSEAKERAVRERREKEGRVDRGWMAGSGEEDGKVYVLEVLQDRCDDRVGRWAGFDVEGRAEGVTRLRAVGE